MQSMCVYTVLQTEAFEAWMDGLDRPVQARIPARLKDIARAKLLAATIGEL